jgi:hypothetical protein
MSSIGNKPPQFIITHGDNLTNINQLQTYEVTNNQFDLNQILSTNDVSSNQHRMINIDNVNGLNMLLNEEGGLESEAETEELLKNIEQMLKSIDSSSDSMTNNTMNPNLVDTHINSNNRALKVNAVHNLQHRILNNNRIIIINNNNGLRSLVKQEPIERILSSNKSGGLNNSLNNNNALGFKKISPKSSQLPTILPKNASVAKPLKPAQSQVQPGLTVPTPESLKASMLKNNILITNSNSVVVKQPIIVANQAKELIQQNQQQPTLTIIPVTGIPATTTVPIIIAAASPSMIPVSAAAAVAATPVTLIKELVTDLPSAKRIKQETTPKKSSKQEAKSVTCASSVAAAPPTPEKPKPPVAFNIPNSSNIDVI